MLEHIFEGNLNQKNLEETIFKNSYYEVVLSKKCYVKHLLICLKTTQNTNGL